MAAATPTTREQVYEYFDAFAARRHPEILGRKLQPGHGLVKSYLLETRSDDKLTDADILAFTESPNWTVTPLDGGAVFRVTGKRGLIGFMEPLTNRHIALHSEKNSGPLDTLITSVVRDSTWLDFAWISSSYFESLWTDFVEPQYEQRYTSMRFEFIDRFQPSLWERGDGSDDDDRAELDTPRGSQILINEFVNYIGERLEPLRKAYPPFNALRMLRIPAPDAEGGFDLWSWGKLTYRSNSFLDGRHQLDWLARSYERSTRAIERTAWVGASPDDTSTADASGYAVQGAPVRISFSTPIDRATLDTLVRVTFARGQGPLRLAGNPIQVAPGRYHVYGIDMHLWQQVYLDISVNGITILLPKGTCGNTVHRMVTNIQRFVSPDLSVQVGRSQYSEIVRDALRSKD